MDEEMGKNVPNKRIHRKRAVEIKRVELRESKNKPFSLPPNCIADLSPGTLINFTDLSPRTSGRYQEVRRREVQSV
ncbi:Hypothetical protein SMAX5B_014722 [Scophthalmus maximus]|uniref:Uncharacterized protein n=1 Tax=Scophthalmus maximus TaxID=52904 RepID=A0A2U9C1Q8_SCOMX|nr:Hypothetical protein SMAX5B_014722 [Scophthalmus maximus]